MVLSFLWKKLRSWNKHHSLITEGNDLRFLIAFAYICDGPKVYIALYAVDYYIPTRIQQMFMATIFPYYG